jgi:hypothetical protein
MFGYLKLMLLSILAFALLITFISFFFPSHVRISKAIDINADKDSVWMQLKEPGNWRNWFPQGRQFTPYIRENGTVEGIEWKKGEVFKIDSVDSNSIKASFGTKTARRGESGWNLFDANVPRTVTVQWYMDFHMRWYPWEKFSTLLLEKRYGPFMEKGLANLKAYLEK